MASATYTVTALHTVTEATNLAKLGSPVGRPLDGG